MIAPKKSATRKPKRKPAIKASASIQLRIALCYITPPIWRMVVVPDTVTLAKLHYIIQIAMGWENCHLHSFEVNGIRYTDPDLDPDDEMGMESELHVRLGDLVRAKVKTFEYEYDFGDGWRHEITICDVLPIAPSTKHPICLDGARACPPEDSGSFHGYTSILEALKAKKRSVEQQDLLDWLGEGYDPERFDREAVNRCLARLKV